MARFVGYTVRIGEMKNEWSWNWKTWMQQTTWKFRRKWDFNTYYHNPGKVRVGMYNVILLAFAYQLLS